MVCWRVKTQKYLNTNKMYVVEEKALRNPPALP